MSAVVVELRPRGIQPSPCADRLSILGDVRRMCWLKGCNRVQIAMVVTCADHWLDNLSPREVMERARAKADMLLNPPAGGAA